MAREYVPGTYLVSFVICDNYSSIANAKRKTLTKHTIDGQCRQTSPVTHEHADSSIFREPYAGRTASGERLVNSRSSGRHIKAIDQTWGFEMLRICIRRAAAFVFLSVVFFSLAAPAQDLKLIGELADRGAWKEAYALSSRMARIATADSRCSESALRQILVLNSALNQASNSRQYGAAWEQLGRYDKALKYYEVTLTTDSSKVWPLAHNGGRIAAQQGDWAQVAYFYRMLEKQTTGWTDQTVPTQATVYTIIITFLGQL